MQTSLNLIDMNNESFKICIVYFLFMKLRIALKKSASSEVKRT